MKIELTPTQLEALNKLIAARQAGLVGQAKWAKTQWERAALGLELSELETIAPIISHAHASSVAAQSKRRRA